MSVMLHTFLFSYLLSTRSSKPSIYSSQEYRRHHVSYGDHWIARSAYAINHTGSLVLAVLLPTVAVLLDPTQMPLNAAHEKAIPLVLGWAADAPAAFKEVMERLDEGVREVLEGSVRLAVSGGRSQTVTAQPSAKKQISLKAF